MCAALGRTLAQPTKHNLLLFAYRPATKIAVAGAVKPELVEVAVAS